MSGEHGKASAHLYDAVGQIWLQAYGDHVHIGEREFAACV